ncbi:IS6 family transposase, partial [Alphaproteobacteria bacterium]|nr:IS6 family transposase [Alphaproteobacteria bacterium]
SLEFSFHLFKLAPASLSNSGQRCCLCTKARFGSKFAREIRKNRAGQHSSWQWHLDEVFVKINGKRFYLWPAVDHEGEFLEWYVTKRRNKAAAKKFLIKAMRKHGSPKIITTDKLPSCSAALREIGIADKQFFGGRANNRCENSHIPFRRRERAMQRFKAVVALQKFVSYHSQIYNYFNHERHLDSRQTCKQKRRAALTEWFNFCAA